MMSDSKRKRIKNISFLDKGGEESSSKEKLKTRLCWERGIVLSLTIHHHENHVHLYWIISDLDISTILRFFQSGKFDKILVSSLSKK